MIQVVGYKHEIDRYIAGVLDGTIVAGRQVVLAVRRHVADLEHAAERGFVFDEFAANEVITFFQEVCVHSVGKWAGEKFVLSDWQKFIVWCLFGWRDARGFRRFRKALVSVARKNGKTTLAAGIALFLLCCDNPMEAAPEVVIAATKEDQARIMFQDAARMVSRSPSLSRLCKKFTKAITVPSSGGILHPIGSDSDTTDGMRPHGVLKDELHAWRERHRGLYEKLATGGAAREQPLDITITTAGDDQSQLWIEESDFASRTVEAAAVDEVVDDSYFAFVASLDADDDPFDETVWAKANPNLGVSVRLEYLQQQANEAKQKPTSLNQFLRYHANMKVASSEKVVPLHVWDGLPRHDKQESYQSYGAFDLGRSNDFAAWAVTIPSEVDDHFEYDIVSESFTCDRRADEIDTAQVRRWVAEGKLVSHPGDSVDFTAFESRVVEVSGIYGVQTWAFDPTFAKQMSQNLLNTHGLEIFPFTQAARWYNEPIRELLRLIKLGWVRHNGCPVLAWQMSNLQIRRNAKDEWLPDKGGSAFKIDAGVSVLMSLSEALYAQKQPVEYTKGSMWE